MKTYKRNSKQLLTIVLIGLSGSGKGTQAKFLLDNFGGNGYYIQTGGLMRELLAERLHNPTLEGFRRIMGTGGLMPGWFPIFLWLREFIEKGCAQKHLVLDGACRRIQEAKLLDDVLAWHNRPLSICLFIDISAAEVEKRLLLRGRKDDTLKAIQNRLAYFPKDVLPVIRYYKRARRLIRINGEQTPSDVWRDIDGALVKRFGSLWASLSKLQKK